MALDWTRHPQHNRHPNGFFVVTYADSPGTYYDEAGNPVKDEVARQAGFNVEEDRVEADKRRQIAKAREDAEQAAQAKIAQIRAGASGEARMSVLKTMRDAEGTYTIVDAHGSRLKERVSYEEAFAAVATANGYEDALKWPTLEGEVDGRNRPTGKFKVIADGVDLAGKMDRAEAEAFALTKIGG